MPFTLEALDADHGDSLILHCGSTEDPKILLIDGGPSRATYNDVIKERLFQIKKELYPGRTEKLPIEMMMVSHIDDDHIDGLLEMTRQMITLDQQGKHLPFDVRTLWHNSFDDLLDNEGTDEFEELTASVLGASAGSSIPGLKDVGMDGYDRAIVASVAQGRDLRKNAERLGIPFNTKSGAKLVMAPEGKKRKVEFCKGMNLTILGPHEARLKKLQKKWKADLKKIKEKELKKKQATASALSGKTPKDTSVANLSSIVVLAEAGGKTMLLTGDALDTDIIFGLEQTGLMEKKGRLHVDLLKLPHHGSDRNVSLSFFKRVTADHYVISADGRHHNPDLQTLEWLDKARHALRDELDPDAFTIHLTHRSGKEELGPKLDEFIEKKEKRNRGYKMVFRDESKLSMKVDLLEPVDY